MRATVHNFEQPRTPEISRISESNFVETFTFDEDFRSHFQVSFPASYSSTRHPTTRYLYIICVCRYSAPTRLTPSLTQPIPPSQNLFGPLPHLYSILSCPTLQSLSVRRLHPSESPKKLDWDNGGLEELVAATGRLKRLGGLGWKEKEGFLEFRRLKGR